MRRKWSIWVLLVGGDLVALAGCSLVANLGQFDGAKLDAGGTDSGALDESSTGDGNVPAEASDEIPDASTEGADGADATLDASEEDADAAETSSDANGADEGLVDDGSDDGTVDSGPDGCGIVSPNLIANAGFECGFSPWFSFAGAALQLVTTPVHSGAHACRVLGRVQTFDGPAQDIAPGFDAGASYNASAWVMVGPNDAGFVPVYMTSTLVCSNSDAGLQYVRAATGTANSTSWSQITGTLIVPAGCTPANPGIYLEGPPAGVDLYVDDVVLSP